MQNVYYKKKYFKMGNSLTKTADIVAYPIKAVGNVTFGESPDDQINIANCNIQEFNSKFARQEEKLIYIVDRLFRDVDSAVNTFNANILFPYNQLLNDNIRILENDINGEARCESEKLITIIEKLMKLYTTNETQYNLTSNGNIIIKNKNNTINKDKTFWNLCKKIESNLFQISTSYVPIQDFLNNHENESRTEFKENINKFFDKLFLQKFSIKQYFKILIKMIDIFIDEIDEHIKFFKQEDRKILGNIYDYSTGFFTWLARSGYSYQGTAKFLTYFKNNNIKILLKEKVNNKMKSFELASERIKSIHQKYDTLYCSILQNITDELRIQFHINNENEPVEVAVSVGNTTISSYETLSRLLTEKIIEKAKEKNNSITFNISHEHGHSNFENLILIESNTQFTLMNNSTILKIIGWNFFNDVKSQNRLNNNNEIIGQFLLSEHRLLNEQINENLQRNLPLRLNNIITCLQDFVQKMDIQRTREN